MSLQVQKEGHQTPFKYSPLNWALAYPFLKSLHFQAFDYEANPLSIRLLRILPSEDFSSEIQCQIFHAKIGQNCASYDALSYVWGDPSVTSPILLNGKRHHVTVNLELALRYLRGTEERIVWIDAICINQQDLREKNYQVQRMRNVYLNARVVVIWLGEEGTAVRALNFCRQIQKRSIPKVFGDRFLDPDINACFDLFVNRPYWNRIWTVQEVCHDREVVIQLGKLNPNILELRELYQRFRLAILQGQDTEGQVTYERYFRIGSLPSPVIWGRHKFSRNQGKQDLNNTFLDDGYETRQPLLDMLQTTRAMEASDPRDKIFALHGLVKEHELITVDYNLSKKDVYAQTTKQLLLEDETALEDILLSVESVNTDTCLPSWVPDFAAKQRSIPLVMRYWARFFNAADRVGLISFYEDGSLELGGCSVGNIASTASAKIKDATIQDDELKKFSIIEFTVNMPFFNRSPSLLRKARRSSKDTYTVNTKGRHFSAKKGVPSPSLLNQNETNYLETSWGPLLAEVGDLICCLHGCRVPLVLREIALTKAETSGGYTEPRFYKLVGACFLINSKLESTPNFMDDPGFSPIMRGSVWETMEFQEKIRHFRLK